MWAKQLSSSLLWKRRLSGYASTTRREGAWHWQSASSLLVLSDCSYERVSRVLLWEQEVGVQLSLLRPLILKGLRPFLSHSGIHGLDDLASVEYSICLNAGAIAMSDAAERFDNQLNDTEWRLLWCLVAHSERSTLVGSTWEARRAGR